MIRVAAVADVHVGRDSVGAFAPYFAGLADAADVLLLGGDLTRVGDPAEAAVLVGELRDVAVPVVAILGNHDYHSDRDRDIVDLLSDAGVIVLEGEGLVLDVDGQRLGVAGTVGFGGGFAGACASDFGEPLMKAFVERTQTLAWSLCDALSDLDVDVRIALTHYAPTDGTLHGERMEIYPFLGSYLLGEAIDGAGADLALHGHAHAGTEKAHTAGGIPVRNVAQPVIKAPYRVFCFEPDTHADARDDGARRVREAVQ